MTDERTLEEKLETRKIPRFDIPATKTREDYHGQRTVVRRVTCERSAVSMHRLLTLLGPTLLKAISWSDEEAPTEDASKKALKDVLNLNFSSDALKTLAVSGALPELKERLANLRTDELYFHVRNLSFLYDRLDRHNPCRRNTLSAATNYLPHLRSRLSPATI